MRAETGISKKERITLLVFAFLAFSFFAFFIWDRAIDSYNNSVVQEQNERRAQAGGRPAISFSVDDFRPLPGGFNLLTLFIFLALIRPKKFIVSTSLTILYGVLLLISLFIRLDGEGALGGKDFYSDPFVELFHKTNIFDYAAGFFILVLLTWQISILWRIHDDNSKQIDLP